MHKQAFLQVGAALDQGGVERGIVEMDAFLQQKGHITHIASAGGRLVAQLKGCHHTLPLNKRTPWHIFYCALRLAQLIRQHNIKLVHARSRAPAWAAYIACRLTGTPFITTFHGTHSHGNRLKRWYNSVMLRGSRVIAISAFIKNHIIEVYDFPADNVDIAARGVDIHTFNPHEISSEDLENLRKTYGIEGRQKIFLLPGRLTRWKGQLLFLEALHILSTRTAEGWLAIILGDAKNQAYLHTLEQRLQQFNLSDRACLLPGQSNLSMWYQLADVVISASTHPEAFGRVAIEAQAMGKPVIATAHGGSLENIIPNETGVLVSPVNAAEMADALHSVVQSTEKWQQMGKKGYTFVRQNYTVESMCQKEYDTYTKVLGDL